MEVILEEELQLDGTQVTVTLTITGVLQWHGTTKRGSLVVQNDLIGIKGGELCIILHAFCIFSQRSSICGAAIPKRKRKDMRLSFANEASQQIWCETIQRFLDEAGRPKKLLVIVNPFGGEGAGKRIFIQIVEPLLLAARISVTMKETMFHGHAKDLAKSADLSQFDGIVCVSGDGVLVEVRKPDLKSNHKTPHSGTGNGMAKSLLHHAAESFDVASATFLIIQGHKRALDVATVAQGPGFIVTGLVADVDFESEKFRWMGRFRFDFQTLVRVVNLQRYNGGFSYLPAEGSRGTGGPYSSELDATKLLQTNEADSDRSWQKGYSGPLQSLPSSEW